ncbi:MAG: hypothetical protein ABI867_16870, partial [Kofleriaceae bacterium]
GLGDSGHRDATALLRFKLIGTVEHSHEVICACFESLFALDRDASSEFAIDQLAKDTGEVGEAAALALGSSRVLEAVEPLIAWCDHCSPERRHRAGYLAIALLRSDVGTAHLLEMIATRSKADAIAAARALAVFKETSEIADQIRVAAAAIKDKAARREIDELLA